MLYELISYSKKGTILGSNRHLQEQQGEEQGVQKLQQEQVQQLQEQVQKMQQEQVQQLQEQVQENIAQGHEGTQIQVTHKEASYIASGYIPSFQGFRGNYQTLWGWLRL